MSDIVLLVSLYLTSEWVFRTQLNIYDAGVFLWKQLKVKEFFEKDFHPSKVYLFLTDFPWPPPTSHPLTRQILLRNLLLDGSSICFSSTRIFPSTFVPPVSGVKNSILDSVLKFSPVKRKKINVKTWGNCLNL